MTTVRTYSVGSLVSVNCDVAPLLFAKSLQINPRLNRDNRSDSPAVNICE